MPHTERKEQLKMYGDAPDTVSVSIVTVADEELGVAGRLFLYLQLVSQDSLMLEVVLTTV